MEYSKINNLANKLPTPACPPLAGQIVKAQRVEHRAGEK